MVSSNTSRNEQTEKHADTRATIRSIALNEFLANGFDGTSVEKVAHAAGISRRTFFRYFQTKEDVVVTGLHESGQFLARLIRERPSDEDAAQALQQGLSEFLRYYERNRRRSGSVLRMIQDNPNLRACFLEHRDQWRKLVAAELAGRMTSREQADLMASIGLSMLSVLYDRWCEDEGLDLAATIDGYFTMLRETFAANGRC